MMIYYMNDDIQTLDIIIGVICMIKRSSFVFIPLNMFKLVCYMYNFN